MDDPNVLKQGRLVEQRKGGAFTSFQAGGPVDAHRGFVVVAGSGGARFGPWFWFGFFGFHGGEGGRS